MKKANAIYRGIYNLKFIDKSTKPASNADSEIKVVTESGEFTIIIRKSAASEKPTEEETTEEETTDANIIADGIEINEYQIKEYDLKNSIVSM